MDHQAYSEHSRAIDTVARMAGRQPNPLLALKLYASLLGHPGGNDVASAPAPLQNTFYLVDFALRCNGFALKSLQCKETTVHAARDYFTVAVSALLPRILAAQTRVVDSGDAASAADRYRPDAERRAEEGSTDGQEVGSGRSEDSEDDGPRTTEDRGQPFLCDATAYVYSARRLEECLQELLRRVEAGEPTKRACSHEFVLLALTLANWACVEMRYRRMAKGYTLLRCSATARRCVSRPPAESRAETGTPSEPSSTSTSASVGDAARRAPNAEDRVPVETHDPCKAWFSHSVAAAVLELNDCAQQLMLCNCPEALEDARSALLALTASPTEADVEGGDGAAGLNPPTTAATEEAQFLTALGYLSVGLAGEYEHQQSALISYHTATSTLEGPGPVPRAALSFEEAARRQHVSSLLARTSERLGDFVAAASGKAIAAAAALDAALNGASRGGGKKLKVGAAGAPGKRLRGLSSEARKSVRPFKSSVSNGMERELVLEVPPIDSALRTCIRRFGLPVLVFGVVSIDEALALLVPPADLATCASPFQGVDMATSPPKDGDDLSSPGSVSSRACQQSLTVAAVMVCMETPLQWAVEAASLRSEPAATRCSVWAPPPEPYIDMDAGVDGVARSFAEVLGDVGPGEFTTRSRLARFLRLAGRYDMDEYDDEASLAREQKVGPSALATVLGFPGESPGASRPSSSAKKPVARGMPAGLLASPLGPPPAPALLDGAKKGVANAVKLLSSRLNALVKAEKAFENRWTATERIKSALMSYFVPQQLTKLKLILLEKRRYRAAREDYCARVLVRFFRRVVLEQPRLQGFLSKNERRALEEEAAAILLQKYGRRWLAVQARKALEAQRAKLVSQVTLVQSMYRRRVATRRVEAIRLRQLALNAAEGERAREHFAALQIQRVYRGHAERLRFWANTGQHKRALLNHLHDSRHYFATQIQKCVRGMLTRLKHGSAVYARRCYGRNVYRTRVLTESSVVIQRYYRGYRVRRQLFDEVSALLRDRVTKDNTGYFFKRYLGPNAITVTPAMLRDGGGLLEAGPPLRADSVAAASAGSHAAVRNADGFIAGGGCCSPPSAADAAAVKIQAVVRRWLAVRQVRELTSSRQRATALRKKETYKPFLISECVF